MKYPTATSTSYLISVIILPTPEEKFHPLLISIRLFSLRSNLALCLVLRILFPILLNHVLFISLHVRAVELVILVKPMGISTHLLPQLIKFTMETEERGQLPFLDALLSKQSISDRQGSFITSVYRKKTYTGLLTNYFSFTPFKYKLGLIKTFIDRAYKINNTT